MTLECRKDRIFSHKTTSAESLSSRPRCERFSSLVSFRDRDKSGGGLRYCAVNHNSGSFIQFRPLACIRAAWNRRSQPEISRIVLVKSLKFHVYSICRDALPARVLSRACLDKMGSDFRCTGSVSLSLTPVANHARLLLFGRRPGTNRHFNQYRGDFAQYWSASSNHPFRWIIR